MNKNTELFTEKSDTYAKYRAGYPRELITEILEPFEVAGKNITVADIGAGTGISSRIRTFHLKLLLQKILRWKNRLLK